MENTLQEVRTVLNGLPVPAGLEPPRRVQVQKACWNHRPSPVVWIPTAAAALLAIGVGFFHRFATPEPNIEVEQVLEAPVVADSVRKAAPEIAADVMAPAPAAQYRMLSPSPEPDSRKQKNSEAFFAQEEISMGRMDVSAAEASVLPEALQVEPTPTPTPTPTPEPTPEAGDGPTGDLPTP
jgi:hypothetical protein